MKHLGELREEATQSAKWRGHNLKWSPPWHGEYRSVQSAECRRCGRHHV